VCLQHHLNCRYKLTNKTALSDDIKAVFPRLVIDSGQELTRGLDNEEVSLFLKNPAKILEKLGFAFCSQTTVY